MQLTPSGVVAWARSAEGSKALKYTATSVVSTIASQLAFILVYGVFRLFDSRGSSITATMVGTVPSYWLNRNWAWGKSGRSHFLKEVAPFWIIAVVGLVFSTWGVDFTKSHTSMVHDHTLRTIELAGAYLGSFGILWIGKFIIFNRFLFAHHGPEDDDLVISAPPTPPLDDFHPHHARHQPSPNSDNTASRTPTSPATSKGV
ncbi:MAG: GtrA family protein [Acidimicrobiales bacterium]